MGKVLFYADKIHLNRYGRPVLGDRYLAMENGPVPEIAGATMRGDSGLLDAAALARAREALAVDGATPHSNVRARRWPDEDMFSGTDLEALGEAADRYAAMPADELSRLVHDEPAYRLGRADPSRGRAIDHEAMLDAAGPERELLLSEIRETASRLVF